VADLAWPVSLPGRERPSLLGTSPEGRRGTNPPHRVFPGSGSSSAREQTAAGTRRPTRVSHPSRRGGGDKASFPGPPPPAPPPPGIFGTFLNCSNFLPLPGPSPAPDFDLHRILPATPGRAARGDRTLSQTWVPLCPPPLS
jgi:hypothetical protein